MEAVAGVCLLLYVPLLLGGVVLVRPLGSAVFSTSTGEAALTRIGETGNRFAIVNAIFHLGPLLLLPAIVALFADLEPIRPGEVAIGTVVGLIAFAVPIGVIFPLNVALHRLAQGYTEVDPPARAALAAVADGNLATQAGGEFVQTSIGGVWVLAISAAILAAPAWPWWLGYLGIVAGTGMVAGGFASLLARVSRFGSALSAFAGFGLLLLAIWLLGIGWQLVT